MDLNSPDHQISNKRKFECNEYPRGELKEKRRKSERLQDEMRSIWRADEEYWVMEQDVGPLSPTSSSHPRSSPAAYQILPLLSPLPPSPPLSDERGDEKKQVTKSCYPLESVFKEWKEGSFLLIFPSFFLVEGGEKLEGREANEQ